jgi:hypothetical protein
MESRRPFCAEESLHNAEPLAATASRVDNWILVEYRSLWGYDALGTSGLGDSVKEHLRRRALELRPSKLLFVRQARRRHRPGLRAFWGRSSESGSTLYSADLESHDQLLGLDFESPGEPVRHPLLLVCTHGKHDRCCARYGRILFDALRDEVDDDWVWQCSHVGGDRFAGNLVCLPEGLYFGRVRPADAWSVVGEYLAGRIHLDCYRGRSCHPFAVQAAERAIREHAGLTGVDDLALVSQRPIRFHAGDRIYEVDVDIESGELIYQTCTTDRLTHPRRYVAGSLRESAA